jgi:DnaJ family protein C protein 13
MISYLLGLLDRGLEILDSPAATKAQIVKALKAMLKSLAYGEEVNGILEKSTVWKDYKDQKHDLFISNTPVAGYLTGRIRRTLIGSDHSYECV